MTGILYQAKAGDAIKKKWLKRTNSFFNTPQEAVSEALALKEKMDTTYENGIQWDYNAKITGSSEKMNILKGYLDGDRESKPFYLQIVKVMTKEKVSSASPFKPKKITAEDKKVLKKVIRLFKI
jgi:hypothetical protein